MLCILLSAARLQGMSIVDKEKEAKIECVIRSAGQVLMDMWPGGDGSRKGDLKDFVKPDGSIVTSADLEANEILVGGIRELFVGVPIMSEESPESHIDYTDDKLWILDPLDGTKHFFAGRDCFAIMLALSEKGVITFGVMYLPAKNQYLSARKGHGTILDGTYIRVSDSMEPRPRSVFIDNLQVPSSTMLLEGGSASSDVVLGLCSGKLDGAIVGITSHKSWDIAPIAVLVEEAGGTFTDENGVMPVFETSLPPMRYGVASNTQIHPRLMSLIPA